ncbi:hypothetical protein OK016_12050 [Vibrio chagasii]|nr:hypothetical protein [Vibrio chagasii]
MLAVGAVHHHLIRKKAWRAM